MIVPKIRLIKVGSGQAFFIPHKYVKKEDINKLFDLTFEPSQQTFNKEEKDHIENIFLGGEKK